MISPWGSNFVTIFNVTWLESGIVRAEISWNFVKFARNLVVLGPSFGLSSKYRVFREFLRRDWTVVEIATAPPDFFLQNRYTSSREKVEFPRLFPPSPYFWKRIHIPLASYSKVHRLDEFDIIRDFWRLRYRWSERWNPGWNNACKLQLSPFCLGKENFVCVSDPQKLRFWRKIQARATITPNISYYFESTRLKFELQLISALFSTSWKIMQLIYQITQQIVRYIHSLPFPLWTFSLINTRRINLPPLKI